MMPYGWRSRLRDAALAGLAGWIAGFIVTIPFEVAQAMRYASGYPHHLLKILAEGFLVWAVFTLFMGLVGWLPLAVPVALLVPPRWIVRWRAIVIPLAVAVAFLSLGWRLHLFVWDQYIDGRAVLDAFITAPNLFAWTFAFFLPLIYILLAARRLRALNE